MNINRIIYSKKKGFSIDQPHLKFNKNENKIIAHGSPENFW